MMRLSLKVIIKKSVVKELVKLPKEIQQPGRDFIHDLQKEGLAIQGFELKKMSGRGNHYRAKLGQSYRVILEYIKPDIIIVKIASREGVYKWK